MIYNIFVAIFFLLVFLLSPTYNVSLAQTYQEAFKAEVVQIVAQGRTLVGDTYLPYQTVKVRLLDGKSRGKELTIEQGKNSTLLDQQKVSVGEKVVIVKLASPQGDTYHIADKYRLDNVIFLVGIFFVLVLLLSRLKGLGSIVGLLISITIITTFIVPQILKGSDPLLISIFGSLIIMTITIYLAHGFSAKTHIALLATFISLSLTGILSYLFVNSTSLTGLGSEDAYSLQFGETGKINLKGLLLGGIIIGALGVLDDITTSLSATIAELKKANPSYTFWQLVKSGMRIGSEHISSLVNTLVLAYAGAGLPLFLFMILNPLQQPLWVILNSELIVEEIIRTLAGSFGLVLAVPITTLLAAWMVSRKTK